LTTEQKIAYIQSFVKLVTAAQTYRDAVSHASFVRGLLAAYNADMTITIETFKQISDDLEVIMDVKRKLPVKGDVL
jgi:hypothetical protein